LRHRLLLFASCLSMATYSMVLTETGPILESMQLEFAVSKGDIGLVFSSVSIGFIIAVLQTGIFINIFSARSITALGQTLLSIGLFVLAFSHSLMSALFSGVLIGLGGGITQVAANVNVSSLYTENRASALSFLHFFYGLGGLLGPLFSSYFIRMNFGWHKVYLVTGVFSAFLVLLIGFSTFPPPQETKSAPVSGMFLFFKDVYMLVILGLVIIYVGIELGITSWSVIYLETHLGAKNVAASSLLSCFWIAMTFGRMLCALLSKKIKAQFLLPLLCLSGLFAYSAFLYTTRLPFAAITITLVGLSFSGIFPLLIALMGNRHPENIASGMGLLMTAAGVGFMTVPWFIGIMADQYSLVWGMRILIIGILVMLFLAGFLMRKTKTT
jgi:fucose permease